MRLFNQTIYLTAKILRFFGYDFNEDRDDRIRAMKKEIENLGGKVEFKIEQYPDGSWVAESVNVDGIVTGGKNIKNMSAEIKDAIFTYFEIPPYLCNDLVLKGDNEPAIIHQNVYV